MSDFNKYKTYDLWSKNDFKHLCCGRTPEGSFTGNEADLNDAEERISRACLAKKLQFIDPCDATTGDKIYGHNRFFYPTDAAKWAIALFSDFPKELHELAIENKNITHPKINDLSPTERKTLLRLVLGMAIDAYGYDAKSNKNTATGEKNGISAKLELHGIKVDADTIRKYLTEAKEIL